MQAPTLAVWHCPSLEQGSEWETDTIRYQNCIASSTHPSSALPGPAEILPITLLAVYTPPLLPVHPFARRSGLLSLQDAPLQ
ncbi:hypothetical protein EYR41_001598 [Orbilia oligospora]|uniref:Uncharacterized protein n=1 Tax=Orbilia oligospora TaxID=2813651 RepID=A0A8H2EF11_ORBOL|nr:hypothetical protein EYR41_001598 [Orbilia oligospora]